MATPGGFLGNGWKFPILPDPSGKLAYVAGNDNVQQSIELLLMTRINERVMRPTFGCGAPSFVFAPGSLQFLNLLKETVSDALLLWEPRVDVLSIDAEANAEDPTQVTVSVSCRVRATNSPLNLVYPFYLGVTEAS
jgi:phage baseplate assembly protein W